jgi:hypothetical protein
MMHRSRAGQPRVRRFRISRGTGVDIQVVVGASPATKSSPRKRRRGAAGVGGSAPGTGRRKITGAGRPSPSTASPPRISTTP